MSRSPALLAAVALLGVLAAIFLLQAPSTDVASHAPAPSQPPALDALPPEAFPSGPDLDHPPGPAAMARAGAGPMADPDAEIPPPNEGELLAVRTRADKTQVKVEAGIETLLNELKLGDDESRAVHEVLDQTLADIDGVVEQVRDAEVRPTAAAASIERIHQRFLTDVHGMFTDPDDLAAVETTLGAPRDPVWVDNPFEGVIP